MTVTVYTGGAVVALVDTAPVPAPTITNVTVTPSSLPIGGGSVTINATITNGAPLLDGVPITLPHTFTVGVSKSFKLEAHGATLPDATHGFIITVALPPVVPPVTPPGGAISSHHKVTITSPVPGARVQTAVPLTFSIASFTGAGTVKLLVDGYEQASIAVANGVAASALTFDPTGLPYGPHTVHLKAFLAGNVIPDISRSVTVMVGTPDPNLPAQPAVPTGWTQYLYFKEPNTGTEGQSYVRHQMGAAGLGPFPMKGTVGIVLRCQLAGGARFTIPICRFLLDNVPISGWLTPVSNQINWNFDTTTIADGSHSLSAETQGPLLWCEAILIEVDNVPGSVTGWRDVWASPTVEEMTYNAAHPANKPYKVRNDGTLPDFAGDPVVVPGRARTPWSLPFTYGNPVAGHIGNLDLWAEPIAPTLKEGWTRHLWTNAAGHVHTCSYMQYQYWHQGWNAMPIIDGPRGVGQFGHAWAIVVNPVSGGFYGISTQGRFWYCHIDDRITTIAGYRRPLDHLPRSPDEAENVGVWVDGPGQFNEPWGLFKVVSDPTFRTLGTLDTYNHCLRKVDLTPLMTAGGVAKISVWAGSKTGQKGYRDGPADQALFDSPWTGDQNKTTLEIAISDFENDAIRGFDPATNMVRTIFKSNAPHAMYLGKPTLNIRPAVFPVSIDGPFATATMYWPQWSLWDSHGNLVVFSKWDRSVGGTLRYIDMQAQTISTIAALTGDGNTRDGCLALSDGTTGPIDSIILARWGDTKIFNCVGPGQYYDSGMQLGIWEDATWSPGVVKGRANQAMHLKYPSAVGCGGGQIIGIGTGAEGSYRYTLKTAADPVLNHAKQANGRAIYMYWWGFRHGPEGQDTLEGNGFAQWRQLSDADLSEWFRSGAGLGHTVTMTDAQLSDVIYHVRYPHV